MTRSLQSSSHPAFSSGKLSNAGTYGFISSNGVPSRMSTPSTISSFSVFTAIRRTTESPIAFGRFGARVAKTPWGIVSRKGITSREKPGGSMECIDEYKPGEALNIPEPVSVPGTDNNRTPDFLCPCRLDWHAGRVCERGADYPDWDKRDRNRSLCIILHGEDLHLPAEKAKGFCLSEANGREPCSGLFQYSKNPHGNEKTDLIWKKRENDTIFRLLSLLPEEPGLW